MAETVPLYLLRHVKAGDRLGWEGDDRDRPATKAGRRQAEALVGRYDRWSVEEIASSPYRRCIDSVQPLAAARGLRVRAREELAEGASPNRLVAALGDLRGPTVWCTHADVVGLLLGQARAGGVRLGPECLMKKGSTWVLEVAGTSLVSARYVAPPA